jgi:hypothetical protein
VRERGSARRAGDGPLTVSLLAVILAGAAALRLWGFGWGLYNSTVSRRPHPDEWVVYWVSHWFGKYGSLTPCPRPGTECFFDWGGVFLYLSYALHALLQPFLDLIPRSMMGPGADKQFIHAVVAGRATSALLSIATVYLTFRLGRAAGGKYVGLAAAAFVALSGLLIELAHFATPDSTTIFFLTATLWSAVEHARAPTGAALVRTGALAGIATGSEYNMALLVLPLAAAWACASVRRLSWLGWSLAGVCVAWIAVNPFAVLQWRAFLDVGLHSLRTRTVESARQYGNRFDAYGPAWLYVVRYPLGYGVGFASTAWMVAGVVWGVMRRSRAEIVLLAWIIPYFTLVTLSPAKFMRYSAPLIPALSVLAAELAVVLILVPLRWPRVVAVAASLLALLYSSGYDAAYTALFGQTDSRAEAAAWIESHASPGTAIGFQEIPDGLLNLPYFVAPAGYQPCFSRFSVSRLEGPARYLLTDSYEREAHVLVSSAQVDQFLSTLSRLPGYRMVDRINHVPSLGPLTFPIGASPHDWRYAAHTITIYAHIAPSVNIGNYCFPTLQQAVQVLYVPPPA